MPSAAGVPNPRDWLKAYTSVQKSADSEILQVIRDATRDLSATLSVLLTKEAEQQATVSDLVRIQQLQTIRRALLTAQAGIFERLLNIVRARRIRAAVSAIKLGGIIDEIAFAAAGRAADARALTAGLTAGLERTLDVVIARLTHSRLTLSERVYRAKVWADGVLDRKINSALARGLSAREFAAEARDWISPNTPGGVRYAALRLARTEINNAFHAVSVSNAVDKPWVNSMDWNLSRSHPEPDICNEIADESPYKPEDVPRKPHPHCFCYVTPTVIPEDDFLDRLAAGQYDDYLRKSSRTNR